MSKKRSKNIGSSMKIVFVLLTLLFFFAFTQEAIAATTGKIAGTVTDSETGEPLPMVNCIIEGTYMGGACDYEGDYFIINVPPGIYSVTARMMGYESVTKTDIIVSVDHTTPVNFELRPVTIEVPGIEVVARREIIKMDISASEVVSLPEEIDVTPLVVDIEDFINLQAGIEGFEIRGGGVEQTSFMLDGLMLVDNQRNEIIAKPNISSIKEFVMVKGGFNAEYGNVRSGVINIITKEGSVDKYNGTINFRYRPPGLKHSDVSVFNPDNFYLRPYLETEDSVCWLGTSQWDEETQKQYRPFEGWIAISEMLLSDDDPKNDRTPEECRDMYMWLHTVEGSSELGQIERKYYDRPDWLVDLSFGGPVPGLSKFLTFFASYRTNHEMFGMPVSREYFTEDNTQLKLTAHLSRDIKLGIQGLYGVTKSVTNAVDGIGGYCKWGSNRESYVVGGDGIFGSDLCVGQRAYSHRRGSNTYWPTSFAPIDVYDFVLGVSLDHNLSSNTFYNLRLTYSRVKNYCIGWHYPPGNGVIGTGLRDTTTIRHFGNTPMDESPYGFWYIGGYTMMTDYMLYAAIGGSSRNWNEVKTINFKGDLTSQINKYNQVKIGVLFNSDNLFTDEWRIVEYNPVNHMNVRWNNQPYRAGAYIQDKIEFEGLISNIGVRVDYSNPNCEWYTADRYSQYFTKKYLDNFEEVCPTEPAESHLRVSPRFGISHPISEASKLYFNYGHFYSMTVTKDLFRLETGKRSGGMEVIGNPSAAPPKTVAYELGYEHNIANMFLLRIAGYYKDVTDQTGLVGYTSFDELVDYQTIENNNYADIRGFEITFEKRAGRWINGWINYDYKVTTSGYIGREHYWEDERKQRLEGLMNPYQERPVARPLLRANITLSTPSDLGPTYGSISLLGDFNFSFLYTWKAGNWITWDPLKTYEVKNNVQWRDYSNVDLRITKEVAIGISNISFYMDIKNLFNTKHLTSYAFMDATDWEEYLESLHLDMYKGTVYEEQGFIHGNDKIGDLKSEGKPYINNPNREFLYFVDLRDFNFGVIVRF